MPSFRFEAMDSTGETQTDQVQAANAEEAIQVLRARGLFVTALNRVTEASHAAGSAEPPTAASDSVASTKNSTGRGPGSQSRRLGLIVAAVGVAFTAAGFHGVFNSALYGLRGKRVDAIVVGFDRTGDFGSDILEFAVSRRKYRADARGSFGIIWAPSHPLGSRYPVLYMSDNPADARLAAFVPRFLIPLFLLGFGLALTAVGVLMRRRGWRPVHPA